MYEELTVAEQRSKRKSRNYSIAIHVLILLLIFIFGRFPDDPKESIDDQYAVAIDFTFDKSSNSTEGQEAAGATPEQADKEERAQENEVKEDVPLQEEEIEDIPDEPVEEIVDEAAEETPDPVVEEVVEDDSPIVAVEDEIVVEKPTKVDVPAKPKKDVPIEKPTEKPTKPSTTSKPTTSKPTTTGTGTGSTNTSTKPSTSKPGTGTSTTGSGSGKDDSGNDGNSGIGTGGTGTGAYDDSGDGIFGRRIKTIPNLGSIMGQPVTGKIVVKTCINPRGNVVHTELIESGTSITDKSLLKDALRVAKNYTFEKDINAPAEQCGKITFILDINKLNKLN